MIFPPWPLIPVSKVLEDFIRRTQILWKLKSYPTASVFTPEVAFTILNTRPTSVFQLMHMKFLHAAHIYQP